MNALAKLEGSLQRQAQEGSHAILSQDAAAQELSSEFHSFTTRTQEELGYLGDASEWTVRGSEDFIADVEDDKRHVASFEAARVDAHHEDARRRRMEYYAQTLGGLAGWIQQSREEQGERIYQMRETAKQIEKHRGISNRPQEPVTGQRRGGGLPPASGSLDGGGGSLDGGNLADRFNRSTSFRDAHS